MLWPGLSSTYYDQIALWFYEENVTHLAMPGIAKAHLTWNSVKVGQLKVVARAQRTTNQLPELRTKKFWQQMPLLKLLWSVKK